VSFRLLVTDAEGWIDQVKVLPAATPASGPPPREEVRRVRLVEPLAVGDAVPDYPFTNELGQALRLSQFKGKALGLTFIFTRCPYPNFCPRMSGNFAEAARLLAGRPDGPTNWHLLSLSFDPDYDTPAVLREYAQRYRHDPSRWSFATGTQIEIDAITEQFGMMFAREGEFFSHNVRTVVLDAQGRVHRIFPGNEWKPPEFVAAMVQAARVY
jgi:protein SCO1/2